MKNKILFLILCIVLISGCSRKLFNDTYKIAVIAPQIGPYKALGLSIINGTELAVEKKNQSGGINTKKIELLKIDDGGLSGEGTWKARDLVSEMVLGVIGHLNSDISIPASEIYSKAKIVEISPGSTNPYFTDREKVRGYVFRTIGRDDAQGKLAADYVIKNKFKKPAILYNNRSYGLSLATQFAIELKKHEIIPSFSMSYKVDECNFIDEINELKKNNIDFVFFVGEYGDAAKLISKLRNENLKTVFLGSEGVFDQDFITSAKHASEEALVISLPEVQDKSFISAYTEKYKKAVGSYSANSYDAANILINAIEKVKEKNSEKIANEVARTMNFIGLTGDISFDNKGDLTEPTFKIYTVKSGKFVLK